MAGGVGWGLKTLKSDPLPGFAKVPRMGHKENFLKNEMRNLVTRKGGFVNGT